MSKTFTLRSGVLAMSLLAASGFAMAADEAPNSPPPGKHAQHRQFDPVAHTHRNLDTLAQKLNLKDEQKSAWQVYADSAISLAKEKAVKLEEHRSHKREARTEVDTATRLDKLSQAMRDRADQLQKVAQDTRAFEGVLSPEQKTIFDLYWKAQFHQRMGHRPLA
ncbi:MAG TPA: Spy/CpxP family protein refolding chaperone [Burkholderiales bacterium]|nr:Spy/CpxP family protein refolding chaperone [Burkholderiales bacterium]